MRPDRRARRLALALVPLFATLSLLTACERVVDVDLATGDRLLVVEGRLEKVQGEAAVAQRIRLTTTDAYFSNSAPPAATGATVRVTDDAGATLRFTPSPAEPGTYVSPPFAAQVGRRYTLHVTWEGDQYQGSDVLHAVSSIDSLYFAERNNVIGPREGLRATIDTYDPGNERNYYLWDQLVDGVRLIAADSAFKARIIANDDLVQGKPVRQFQPYGGMVVTPGQVVTVRQVGLSEDGYRYYVALTDQVTNNGSPFAVATASVRGNVANRTRPSRRALGYFMAGEVSEVTRTVPGAR
ncbi:MAG TPA: DUF4249 domain-containing protein [Gemmatimonadaceae bacterium]|nr:DUF4249 domain-containing protein [Gemmatimonadaceae bacterium]